MTTLADTYYSLLKQAVFGDELEVALSGAADLGRSLLKMKLMPEDVAEIHQQALMRLADEQPDLKLSDVAANLMAPLMEVSMAYSLALRSELHAKKMLQAQLAQVGRMEAIGTMAAGIAHDFNTILGVINGYAELLLDDFPAGSANCRHRNYTQQILDASARARELILRMLAFARQRPIEPVLLDAVALVRETLQMIRVTLPPAIALVFEPEMAHAQILADPMQIQQIVMNLFMNAVDAMDGHGVLHIGIAPESSVGTDPGRFKRLCLTVADDGCGMTHEEQRRAFDPFFTTKAPGKGSGLGLSVVYGTVTDLLGEIQLTSAPGKGTCFSIFLPLAEPGQADVASS
jgi:signal transduction histidine kinase